MKENKIDKLSKISAKKIGANLILVFDKKDKYSRRVTKEEGEDILSRVEKFNNSKGVVVKERLAKTIINFMTYNTIKKTQEEEKTTIAAKSLEKRVKKEEIKEQQGTRYVHKNAYKTISKKANAEERDEFVLTPLGLALKGFERVPMPELLIKKVLSYLDNKISVRALINFWLLCLQNPNHIARTRLFKYLEHHRFIITPTGYFITYRLVKKTDQEGVFTHARTDFKGNRLFYKIGVPATMPRKDCDEDGKNDCSRGLHVGAPAYIGLQVGEGYGDNIKNQVGTGYESPRFSNQDWLGDIALLCLVNPAHVVSVPNSDTRKLRCCEFYPAKVVNAKEVADLEYSDLHVYESEYNKIETEELKKSIEASKLKGYFEKEDYNQGALTKLRNKLKDLVSKKEEYKMTLGANHQDGISNDLDVEEIKKLVNSRLSIIS